jgi:hypothetical protein
MSTIVAIDRRALWFTLLAAPTAWTVQGLLGWWAGERICADMSIGGVRGLTALVSMLALIVALVSVATAWRAWAMASSAPHAIHAEAWDRVEFMALSGLFISAAFTLGIIWGALPSLMLSACGRVR